MGPGGVRGGISPRPRRSSSHIRPGAAGSGGSDRPVECGPRRRRSWTSPRRRRRSRSRSRRDPRAGFRDERTISPAMADPATTSGRAGRHRAVTGEPTCTMDRARGSTNTRVVASREGSPCADGMSRSTSRSTCPWARRPVDRTARTLAGTRDPGPVQPGIDEVRVEQIRGHAPPQDGFGHRRVAHVRQVVRIAPRRVEPDGQAPRAPSPVHRPAPRAGGWTR